MSHARAATRALIWMGAWAVGVVGCSAGGGGKIADAHPVDAYEVSLDLPPGCPPEVGNDKGVGKPCTRGGRECTGGSSSNFVCTCDDFLTIRLVGVPCICTFVTINGDPDAGDLCAGQPSNVCGTNAGCCAYGTIGTYCVPNICLAGGDCPAVSVGP